MALGVAACSEQYDLHLGAVVQMQMAAMAAVSMCSSDGW